MKTFNLFFAVLFSILFLSNKALSQEFSASELIDNILEVQSMRELTKFREDLVKELKNLDMSNITPEESEQLAIVYDKMRVEYNSLIGLIKQDVLDFKNIKKMTKSSSEISSRYRTTINNCSNIFNNEFTPLYSSLSQERSFIALIFPLIEKGIRFIIDVIKEKKLKKETLMNDLLNVTNLKFNNVLILPEWNQIVKTKISNVSLTKINTVTVNEVQTASIENTDTKSSKLKSTINIGNKTAPIDASTNLTIEYPAMKELKGNIEFVILDESGNSSNMEFYLPESISKERDLKVGTKNNITSTSFGSRMSFANGTSFQVRITNTAFAYVFAFNTNFCYPIYPYTQEWLSGFEMTKSRDLGVGPLMLKDDNNLLVIPSKNVNTGEENYIQIYGNTQKEILCLILSKSELNLEEICDKIDASTGDLSTRVNTVFSGDNIAKISESNLKINNGKINFEVVDNQRWILPLIFEIKRSN